MPRYLRRLNNKGQYDYYPWTEGLARRKDLQEYRGELETAPKNPDDYQTIPTTEYLPVPLAVLERDLELNNRLREAISVYEADHVTVEPKIQTKEPAHDVNDAEKMALETLTRQQLLDMAVSRGITGMSRASRADILAALL